MDHPVLVAEVEAKSACNICELSSGPKIEDFVVGVWAQTETRRSRLQQLRQRKRRMLKMAALRRRKKKMKEKAEKSS